MPLIDDHKDDVIGGIARDPDFSPSCSATAGPSVFFSLAERTDVQIYGALVLHDRLCNIAAALACCYPAAALIAFVLRLSARIFWKYNGLRYTSRMIGRYKWSVKFSR